VQLRSEGRAFRLQPVDSADLLKRLIPLLDGTRTVAEIVNDMSDFDEPQIVDSLQNLYRARLIEDSASPATSLSESQQEAYASQITFLSHFTSEPHKAQATLAKSRVAVLGLGTLGRLLLSSLADNGVGQLVGVEMVMDSSVEADATCDLLQLQGIEQKPGVSYRGITLNKSDRAQIGAAVEGVQFLVMSLDSPDPDLLYQVNEACIQAEIAWMPLVLQAWEGLVGPTVIPHQTACYKCYDLRMKANLTYYEQHLLYEEHLRTAQPRRPFGELPQLKRLLADIAATEVIKMLVHFYPPTTIGRVFNLNFLTLNAHHHDVLRLPRCPACGEPSQHRPMMNPWTV